MTDPDLIRFIEAQNRVRLQVENELASGRKLTHWMWFVFPQLAGLGRSATAQYYGIADVAQAARYLDDPVLGERLRGDVKLMLRHAGRSAQDILGSPDDLKFQSCLTLFGEAARDPSDRALFSEALQIFYSGKGDHGTLALLGGGKPG